MKIDKMLVDLITHGIVETPELTQYICKLMEVKGWEVEDLPIHWGDGEVMSSEGAGAFYCAGFIMVNPVYSGAQALHFINHECVHYLQALHVPGFVVPEIQRLLACKTATYRKNPLTPDQYDLRPEEIEAYWRTIKPLSWRGRKWMGYTLKDVFKWRMRYILLQWRGKRCPGALGHFAS